MIDLIKQVPDVIWAAAIASFLTLGGVLLSNRNSRIQNLANLDHDAAQRDRDREMSLRRGVYLEAAAAISRGQNILTRMADLDIADQQFSSEFRADSSALARIQVVGTNITVQTVSLLLSELSEAYLKLSLKRVHLIERKNYISFLAKGMENSDHEQDRIISLMKELDLDGNINEEMRKALKNNYEFEREQHTKYSLEQHELHINQTNEHLAFAKLCYENYEKVSQLIPPVVFAIRKELELPLDEEAYLSVFQNNLKRGKEAVESFLTEIEELSKS